jgi:hypothetical protein
MVSGLDEDPHQAGDDYQPRSESCQTEDGSFRTDDASGEDTQVDRQLVDEVQYRERSNAELQLQKSGRET